jgi:hypothetical protein
LGSSPLLSLSSALVAFVTVLTPVILALFALVTAYASLWLVVSFTLVHLPVIIRIIPVVDHLAVILSDNMRPQWIMGGRGVGVEGGGSAYALSISC